MALDELRVKGTMVPDEGPLLLLRAKSFGFEAGLFPIAAGRQPRRR